MLNETVDFLNYILQQDRVGVSNIFLDCYMPASQEWIDHPTIQVTTDDRVRLIGILNGFVLDCQKTECLRMVIDDKTGLINRFELGPYK
jgi:hypothetical protein